MRVLVVSIGGEHYREDATVIEERSLEIRAVDPADSNAAALVADFFSEVEEQTPVSTRAANPLLTRRIHPQAGRHLPRCGPVAGGRSDARDFNASTTQRARSGESSSGRPRVARASPAPFSQCCPDAARGLGYELARLDTGDKLPEARSLFLAFGFKDIDNYNGSPYADYWMELAL